MGIIWTVGEFWFLSGLVSSLTVETIHCLCCDGDPGPGAPHLDHMTTIMALICEPDCSAAGSDL